MYSGIVGWYFFANQYKVKFWKGLAAIAQFEKKLFYWFSIVKNLKFLPLVSSVYSGALVGEGCTHTCTPFCTTFLE